MNLIIPFEKVVKFDTPVSEISSISLEHEITKNEREVLGNFIIKGTYKEYELSLNKKDFSFITCADDRTRYNDAHENCT